MAIPVILKGETPKPIPLALKEGYDYSGCCLHVEFCGLQDTFINLEAGGRVDLRYTAEQTAVLPLGTSKVMLSLENANGEVRFMPWAKIKVTDSPADLYDGVITIDPATLNVDDLTAADSLGTVKDRLQAVISFLRALKVIALAALPFVACADVAPLYTTPNDMPGDAPLMTNTEAFVESMMEAAGKVKSVNSKTGDVEIAAADVRGIGIDYVALPFETGRDYAEGDVVTINDRFYRFNQRWRKQWGDDPIGYECVDELTDFAQLGGAVMAQQFLTLGFGGTNAPSCKLVNAGYDNERWTYFTLSPSGMGFEDCYGGEFRMVADELRYTGGGANASVRIRDILTLDSTRSFSGDNLTEANKKYPTSAYYVYTYLANNYLTALTVSDQYLKKSDASGTYLSQTDAASTYSTPADVASSISSALGSLKVTYLYNVYGNYRLNVDGRLQRQTHSGANINWTNESTGVTLMYNGVDSWHCDHPQLGSIYFTRSNGVVVCNEYPIIRATEDYPDATVLNFTSPIGTMRAFPNAYGSLSWENYDRYVTGGEITNYYTKAETESKIVELAPALGNYSVVSNRAMTALQSFTETDPTISSWAKAASKPTYTADEVGAVSSNKIEEVRQDNAQTRQIVTTWENFLDGSNVVFSITNYLSGSYNLDAAKLRILELREGEYHEVFNSRDEILLHIENFRTNDFRVATNQLVGAVNEAIGGKADRDWGKYTSAGGEAPSNTVYMTAPNTVFAGGLEYERVAVGEGTICVLTTRGAPTWTQGDEGTFKFQDDGGTNYFGFAKTDSYTIGANTDGITVQGGMVTMNYNITMSGRPCVWYKSSLSSGAWEQLNLPDGSPVAGASHAVTWEANPDPGTQVCYINVGNAPSGFFRATVEVTGEAKFMTNMPADMSGGIVCPNTATGVSGVIKPTFDGTSVIWTWSAK